MSNRRFKVGDSVKRMTGSHGGMKVGDIGTVTGIDSDGVHIRLKEYNFGQSECNFKLCNHEDDNLKVGGQDE